MPKIVGCRACGARMSVRAEQCPQCGDIPTAVALGRLITILPGVALIFLLIFFLNGAFF